MRFHAIDDGTSQINLTSLMVFRILSKDLFLNFLKNVVFFSGVWHVLNVRGRELSRKRQPSMRKVSVKKAETVVLVNS